MAIIANVRRLIPRQNMQCNWTRKGDQAQERLSTIDRRDKDSMAEYPVCVLFEQGVYAERLNYEAKVIPWNCIDDIDVDYVSADLIAEATCVFTGPTQAAVLAAANCTADASASKGSGGAAAPSSKIDTKK